MSTTTLTFDTATTIAMTMVLTGILKGFLEIWVTPANRLHDPAIQLLALVIGVGWSLTFLWAAGPVGRTTTVQGVVSVVLGLTGGSASIGMYHVNSALTRTTPVPTASGQTKDQREGS